jgi:hypothetical protein
MGFPLGGCTLRKRGHSLHTGKAGAATSGIWFEANGWAAWHLQKTGAAGAAAIPSAPASD